MDVNSLVISSSSEEPREIPTVSVKLFPLSSESTYEVISPLCKTKPKIINPNDLVREKGYVVSEDPRFRQTIEVEECEDEGSTCSFFVLNMKSSCTQRYMGIQLKVFTSDMQEKMEWFQIPSICECALLFPRKRDLAKF